MEFQSIALNRKLKLKKAPVSKINVMEESIWIRKQATQAENKAEEQRLPSLHYAIVLKILDLAEANNFDSGKLVALRSKGEGWRLAVDNFHLPFCHVPISIWSPYTSDDPEKAIARSNGKCFKFPQDIQLFHEMCGYSHNPFPTRELKIWYQAKLSPLEDFSSCFPSIGNHLWSLTYVIGPSLDSIRLLYDLLPKLPYLEDLRVIETHSADIQDEIDKLKKQPKSVSPPTLQLPTMPKIRLTCLSVTGSHNSFILDELLEAYGKRQTLECLEVQGMAVSKSVFLEPPTNPYLHFQLTNLKKLRVCGGTDDILGKLNVHNWNFNLTHVSLNMIREPDSPLVSDRVLSWLYWIRGIKELYFYFDNLNEITVPRPKITLRKDVYTIRKLGLPYKFVQWDCWALSNCPHVEEVEFHDWSGAVSQLRRDANTLKFLDAEKSAIRSAVSQYKSLYYLSKITVRFGTTSDNTVVLRKEDLMHRYYHSYDDDYDYDWR